LPRQGIETVLPLLQDQKPVQPNTLLKATGVETLQRLGYTGFGVKVVVIGSDFSGADKLIGTTLPKRTRILDLTTELNSTILPSPGDPSRSEASIAVARSVAMTAPDAELILVRIDTGSFFQLPSIVRLARGEITYSTAMRSRLFDLSAQSADLTKRKQAALAEYRLAFEDLADDEVTRARRLRARANLNALVAQQAEFVQRLERFNSFQKLVLASLSGARVIVNPLVWESGYPLDALSDLSRTLDRIATPPPTRSVRPATGSYALPKSPIVWVQAASPSGPAVWGGTFVDQNHNGTMEFAPASSPLPPGSWTPEMNFMAFQTPSGSTSNDLPAGTKIRFVIQWREPLDPKLPGLDLPAYPVVLRIFQQLDPKGEKLPSDEMAERARSVGGPYPIFRANSCVVYEQLLEFTVPEAGRYSFVVATGYQPDPLLPALRRDVQINPRVFLETLAAKPGEGRAVFQSYVTPRAGVGIPGDSPGAVTIGVSEVGALVGGGTGITLESKPDLYGPETLNFGGEMSLLGPGVATGYVAGIAVDLVQAEVAGANVFRSVGAAPGKSVVIPEAWLRYVRPSSRRLER
jgi:hypothetical protein